MHNKLMEQIQNGNLEALNKLIKENYTEIYRFLCRRLPSYSDAEDVTQIVFIKMAKNIHNYKEKGKFQNYLFRLAVNCSNDFYRRYRATENIDDKSDLVSQDRSLQERTEAEYKKELVKKALHTLPDYQRDVIILRFYHDFSFKDISKITRTNLSSAKSRYRQGMTKLKNLLIEVDDFE